jgi:hypothetical protein
MAVVKQCLMIPRLVLGLWLLVGHQACHRSVGSGGGVLRAAPQLTSRIDLHLQSDGFELFTPNLRESATNGRASSSELEVPPTSDPTMATADVISGRWIELRGRQPLLIRQADEPLLEQAQHSHVIVELSRGNVRLVAPRCARQPLQAGQLTLHSEHGSLQGKMIVRDGIVHVQSALSEPGMPMVDVQSIDAPVGSEVLQCELPADISDGRWWLQVRFSIPIQLAAQASIEFSNGQARVIRQWRLQLPVVPTTTLTPQTQIALWPSSSLSVDSVPLLIADVARDSEWVTLYRHDEYQATLEHVVRTVAQPSQGAASLVESIDDYHDELWVAADVAMDGLAFASVTGVDMYFAHLKRTVLKSGGTTRLFIANRKGDLEAISKQQRVNARGQSTLITALSLRNSSAADVHLHWYSNGLDRSWQRADQPWHDDAVAVATVESTALGQLVRCTIKAGATGEVGLNWRQVTSTLRRHAGPGDDK